MKKYTLVIFALLIISLSGTYFLDENKVSKNHISTPKVDKSINKLMPLVKPNNIQPVTVVTPNEPQVSVNTTLEDEQFIPEEETYPDNIEDPSIAQPKKHLPFKDQVVDYDWATDFTYEMYDLIASHEELTEHNIKDIECRATLCHLQFYVDDEDQAVSQAIIAGKVLTTGDWQGHSFYFIITADPQVMMIEIGRFKEG